MKSKKLSIKRMTGDEFEGAQGHHGIFDGDDYMGHVHADDMMDHVTKAMADGYGNMDGLKDHVAKMAGADDFDDLMDKLVPDKDARPKGQAGVKGHQEPDQEMSELLRESGFCSAQAADPKNRASALRDQVRAALKLAATHQLVEQREAARNLILTECLETGKSKMETGASFQFPVSIFNSDKAKQLLHDGKITAADLLDAIEAKDALSQAIAAGKVLPKDRAFFFEIALNNPRKFSEYIAGAVPVLRLGTVGLGDTQQLPVDQEVDAETKKLMSEKKLSYGKAMKEVFRSNPQLEDRYRAAHRQQPKQDAPAVTREGGITQ